MNEKSVVLLSAGLDSSFNLFRANQDTEVLLALTFDYGQKAAVKEIQKAKALAESLKIRHLVIDLRWFKSFTKTSLVDSSSKLPLGEGVNIGSTENSLETAKAVWVPNRNGIFLNIAAGFAEGLKAQWVVPGFNKEEAQTFPDNSAEFIQALDQSFHFSTQARVKVRCYSQDLSKAEIIEEALKLKIPFEKLWPCYQAEEAWCGRCESCQRFSRALAAHKLSFTELNKQG